MVPHDRLPFPAPAQAPPPPSPTQGCHPWPPYPSLNRCSTTHTSGPAFVTFSTNSLPRMSSTVPKRGRAAASCSSRMRFCLRREQQPLQQAGMKAAGASDTVLV